MLFPVCLLYIFLRVFFDNLGWDSFAIGFLLNKNIFRKNLQGRMRSARPQCVVSEFKSR